MVELGQTGFFVEGPVDAEGNRSYAAAVVEGEVVQGPYKGLLQIQVTAPPEFLSRWPGGVQNAWNWMPTEGPARMITREERVRLAAHAGGVALPATD